MRVLFIKHAMNEKKEAPTRADKTTTTKTDEIHKADTVAHIIDSNRGITVDKCNLVNVSAIIAEMNLMCDFVERIESSHILSLHVDVIYRAHHLPMHIKLNPTHSAWLPLLLMIELTLKSAHTQQPKTEKSTLTHKHTNIYTGNETFEKSAREIFAKIFAQKSARNAFNWIKWKKIPQNIALDNDF